MIVFPWLEKYRLNIANIDDQHKKLVDLLNNLATAMSEGKGNDVMERTLKELIDYSIYHFKEEEKYFVMIDYPQAEEHRKEHKELIEKVERIQADFESKKVGISIELMRFLKDWLINHIGDTDKQLSFLLNDAGIK